MPTFKPLYFVILLNVMNILIVLITGFMMPIWGDFVAHLGGNIRTAGNAIGIFSLIIGALTFITGKIESHVKRDIDFVIITQGIMTLCIAGYLIIDHIWQLYTLQALLGIAGAFQVPALYALYHRYMPQEGTTLYWGIWNGFYNLAIGFGAWLSAYLVHHFGFNVMFTTLTALSTLCFIVSIYFKRQPAENKIRSKALL